jgi:protoporphyrinogen/coproporphyrinogen III oxidase
MRFTYSSNTPTKDVLVVGAGISGLSAAFYLKQAGLSVDLFEATQHAGGAVQSHRSEEGFLSELGPHTLQLSYPAVRELIEALNLQDQMLSPPSHLQRLVIRNKALIALPQSLWDFVKTPLLSWKEKLRLLSESTTPSFRKLDPLSLSEYFSKRFGKAVLNYFIDPFVAGIYGGDPSKLSFKYSFPKLYAIASKLEKKRKSLLFYILRKKLHKNPPPSVSFKDGMFTLPAALIDALKDELKYETKIKTIHYDEIRKVWSVSWQSPEHQGLQTIDYKHLWFTIPSYKLKDIRFADTALRSEMQHLSTLEMYAPIACLSLGIDKRYFKTLPEAFGFLCPSCEHFEILGVLFTSFVFPNRAPEGYVTLAAFIGGDRARTFAEMKPEQFERLTLSSLVDLGLIEKNTQASFRHHTLWRHGIPQYTFDNQEILHKSFQKLSQHYPTLHFTGSYIDGIALSGCIHNSKTRADAIIQSLAQAKKSS